MQLFRLTIEDAGGSQAGSRALIPRGLAPLCADRRRALGRGKMGQRISHRGPGSRPGHWERDDRRGQLAARIVESGHYPTLNSSIFSCSTSGTSIPASGVSARAIKRRSPGSLTPSCASIRANRRSP